MGAVAAIEESSFLRYTWADFAADARFLAGRISWAKVHLDGVYGIPRGGLVLATYLSHALRLPLIVDPTRVTSSGVRRTLVVDDALLTGMELAAFVGCHKAVLIYHPFGNAPRPQFVAHESDLLPCFPWEADGADTQLPLADVIGALPFTSEPSRAGAY